MTDLAAVTLTCSVCGLTAPLDAFRKDKNRPFGRIKVCKPCSNFKARASGRAYKAKNQEKLKQAHLRRRRSADFKAKRKAAIRRNIEHFSVRARARGKLHYEMEMGRIVRPSECSDCGSTVRVEAHHEDYSKPLDVVWLCSRCHGLRHRLPTVEPTP